MALSIPSALACAYSEVTLFVPMAHLAHLAVLALALVGGMPAVGMCSIVNRFQIIYVVNPLHSDYR